MIDTALIVGYGRAGQRHWQTLNYLFPNITIVTVDPVVPASFDYLEYALYYQNISFDCAVICTPPAAHLEQIVMCLDRQIPVMCEKPLCDIGQMTEALNVATRHPLAEFVTVAYNYRYHALVKDRGLTQTNGHDSTYWYLECYQHRTELPEWGLLLDHLSHDVDILCWYSQKRPLVEKVTHTRSAHGEEYNVTGWLGDRRFEISEMVNFRDTIPRRARLTTPNGWADIFADQRMYQDMWLDFDSRISRGEPGAISLDEAIRVQEILEEIDQCARM